MTQETGIMTFSHYFPAEKGFVVLSMYSVSPYTDGYAIIDV